MYTETRWPWLMVSVLDSESSGPGSSTGRGHCFRGQDTLLSTLTVPLSTQEYKYWYRRIVGAT